MERHAMPVSTSRCRSHVAMAGILRQLGDLAELAADVLEDLHEQVMEASARGRRLAARAKKLEAVLVDDQEEEREREGVFLHRLSWPKVRHGVVAGGDLPCFITEYINKCRGPPALSILDKYDAGGDGACLRRYTDPSFFFRANSAKSSEDCKPPKSSIPAIRSENASPRFLPVLRQLKHGQTSGSVLSSLKPRLKQNIQKHSENKEVGVSFTSLPDDLYTGLGEIALDPSTTTKKAKAGNAVPFCSDAGSDYGGECGKLGRTSSFEAWLSLSPDFRIEESYQAKQGSCSLPEKSTSVQAEDADVVIPQLPPMQWLSVKVHTRHFAPRRKYRHNPSDFAGPVAEAERETSSSNLRQEPRRQNLSGDTDHNYMQELPDRKANTRIPIARQAMCRSNESVFISAVQELAKTSDCWE